MPWLHATALPKPSRLQTEGRVIKNLRETLEIFLAHHLTSHRKKKTQAMTMQQGAVGLPEKRPIRSSPQTPIQSIHREERLAKYEQVLALLKPGMTPRAMADQACAGLITIQNGHLAATIEYS